MKAALFLLVGKGEFVEVWQLKIIVGDDYRGGLYGDYTCSGKAIVGDFLTQSSLMSFLSSCWHL